MMCAAYIMAKSASAIQKIQLDEKPQDAKKEILQGVQRGGYLGGIILGAAIVYGVTRGLMNDR